MKFYVSSTWELFCSFLFLYGKCACILLFAMTNIRASAYFSILSFVLWLVLSHPTYSQPSKIVKATSLSHLAELLGVKEDEIMQICKAKHNKKL